MKLLISQKDELFDIIEGSEFFTPSQFDIVEIPQKHNDVVTEISFKNSPYYFRIVPESTIQGLFFANFSPGEKSIVEATSTIDWNIGTGYIYQWLLCLRKELTAPNKWASLMQELEAIHFVPTDDSLKFSYHEYVELADKIKQIKASLDTIPLLHEQQQAISNQLDHLTELAKDLNKFDWKSLFIGTIVSIVIQLYVSKENTARLWALIRQAFASFFLP